MNEKKISVIMGIYNCSNTLGEAIESILNQTYSNWELVMCDDGSTDDTFVVASSYQKQFPEQIILLKNDKNMGLNYTLNKCLHSSIGEYIARMDGDDTCSPERFAEEVKVLDEEKDISIVSTDMTFFDGEKSWGLIRHPEYPQKRDFAYGSPFGHAPSMVRREAYDAVQGYAEGNRFLRVEDYHLWVQMHAAGYRGKNIHKPLYQIRENQVACSRRKFRYRINAMYVRFLAVRKLRLPFYYMVFALRPIVVGLVPRAVYIRCHNRRMGMHRKKENI